MKVELKEEQSLLEKEAKTLKESLSVKFKSVTSSSSANETASEQSQPSVTDPIPASKPTGGDSNSLKTEPDGDRDTNMDDEETSSPN